MKMKIRAVIVSVREILKGGRKESGKDGGRDSSNKKINQNDSDISKKWSNLQKWYFLVFKKKIIQNFKA